MFLNVFQALVEAVNLVKGTPDVLEGCNFFACPLEVYRKLLTIFTATEVPKGTEDEEKEFKHCNVIKRGVGKSVFYNRKNEIDFHRFD